VPVFLAALIAIGAPFFMVEALRRGFVVQPQPRAKTLFVAGAATAFVALVIERLIWPQFATLLPTPHAMFLRAFFVIALIEEIAKLGLICGQLTDDQAPDYRGFAIVAAAVGAGFAGAENVLYVLRYGPDVMLARTFTATPFHICNAIVASRMLWLGFREGKQWYLPAALVSAVFLHGLYDYSIFTDTLGDGKFLFALAMTGSIAIGLMRRNDSLASGC
jgi:RsiW-degrading membrane proteinase PrsW (M82 family)